MQITSIVDVAVLADGELNLQHVTVDIRFVESVDGLLRGARALISGKTKVCGSVVPHRPLKLDKSVGFCDEMAFEDEVLACGWESSNVDHFFFPGRKLDDGIGVADRLSVDGGTLWGLGFRR